MKSLAFIAITTAIGFALGWVYAPNHRPAAAGSGPPSESVGNREAVPQSASATRPFQTPDLQTADQCAAALAAAIGRQVDEHPMVSAALKDYALRRWLEIDAESALGFAEARITEAWKPEIAADLFRVWLDMDPRSALQSFAQASPALIKAAHYDFFMNLAEIDPQQAVKEWSSERWRSSEYEYSGLNQKLYQLWAASDPAAAAEAAKAGSVSGQVIAKVWAETDLDAAMEFFGEENRDWFLPKLLERNPNAAVEKDALLRYTGASQSDYSADSAIAIARNREVDDDVAKNMLLNAAALTATAEPERALALLVESGAKIDWRTNGILMQAFASLAAENTQAQLGERLKALPEEMRTDALAGAITHRHAVDPAATALQLREWLEDPQLADQVMPAMEKAYGWGHGGGAQDLGGLLETIPEFGPQVRGYLMQGWVKTDPEEAAAFMAGELARGADNVYDHEAVAELAYSRPEFTAQWLADLPAGEFRDNTAAALAANWSRFDPASAAQWVTELPAGAIKDAASEHLEK